MEVETENTENEWAQTVALWYSQILLQIVQLNFTNFFILS